MEYVGYIVLPLIASELFYIIYNNFVLNILYKRYKLRENKINENREENIELTKESLKDKKIIIAYIVSTIIGIMSVFFVDDFYGTIFLENLKAEFQIIFISFLFFLSFYLVIKRIKYIVVYIKSFLKEMKE